MNPGRNIALLRLANLIAFLRRRPRDIRECSEQFNVTTRTIYRDLTALSELGLIVVNTNESGERGKYFVERHAPCPLCQREFPLRQESRIAS